MWFKSLFCIFVLGKVTRFDFCNHEKEVNISMFLEFSKKCKKEEIIQSFLTNCHVRFFFSALREMYNFKKHSKVYITHFC